MPAGLEFDTPGYRLRKKHGDIFLNIFYCDAQKKVSHTSLEHHKDE